MSERQGFEMTEVRATRPIATSVPPAPRSLSLLVATIVLLGVPVAVVGQLGQLGPVLYLANAGIGALLAIRRPRNPIGWLLIGIGWAIIGQGVPVPATTASLQAGTASAFAMLIAWWSAWGSGPSFLALFLIIMVIFPAGHVPTGRWRGPATIAIAAVSFAVVLTALAPTIEASPRDGSGEVVVIANPLTFLPDLPWWAWLTSAFPVIVLFVALAGGVGSMVVRVRRARDLERQQLRWVVAAFAAVTGAVAFGLILQDIFGDAVQEVAWLPAEVALPLPAVAIGVAILRYRLYEINRIISRTLSYAVVSGFLVVVFAGVILLLQDLLAPLTQGQTLAVAGSTLVVFALFQPVRHRVQRVVDRRFDRARYDAGQTIITFTSRLNGDVDLVTVTSEIVATASAAVRPSAADVWLRGGRARAAGVLR